MSVLMTFEPEWFLHFIIKATSNQESTTSSLEEILIWLVHAAGVINANERKTAELFTPTWNGIAVSVRYVSPTPVVFGAILND